jgi:uncharacterized metal-binding protein YceD (DUF177 family)
VNGEQRRRCYFFVDNFFYWKRIYNFADRKKGIMPGLYSIPLAGLKEARYTYDFIIGDDFFEAFEGSEIKRGELNAVVVLQKSSTHFELDITINGHAEVICDRCLDTFYLPLTSVNRLVVKLGREWDEADPDLITMPLDEHEIDLSQYFYEYIHLALPLKRIHPDDNGGRTTCNPEMIRKLEDHLITGEGDPDPRWDELKKLTENN